MVQNTDLLVFRLVKMAKAPAKTENTGFYTSENADRPGPKVKISITGACKILAEPKFQNTGGAQNSKYWRSPKFKILAWPGLHQYFELPCINTYNARRSLNRVSLAGEISSAFYLVHKKRFMQL